MTRCQDDNGEAEKQWQHLGNGWIPKIINIYIIYAKQGRTRGRKFIKNKYII